MGAVVARPPDRVRLFSRWGSLDEIAAILAGRTSTHDWRDTITARITAIDARIEQLIRVRTTCRTYIAVPLQPSR
jgi:hypothetical protein